jgi:predicted amidophosphoribosyltransferase
MLPTGIDVEAVRLSRAALAMFSAGRFVCALCGNETDDATKPCQTCGAPWPERLGSKAQDWRNHGRLN